MKFIIRPWTSRSPKEGIYVVSLDPQGNKTYSHNMHYS